MVDVWVVTEFSNIDGMLEVGTYLFLKEEDALEKFRFLADQDLKLLQSEGDVQLNNNNAENFEDGETIVHYSQYEYTSFQYGYASESMYWVIVKCQHVQ